MGQVVQQVIDEEQLTLSRIESQVLLNQIIDEVTGFGQLNS